MWLVPFLLLPEFSIVEMVGILMDGYLHAPSSVQDVKLVVDEDMPIMAPIGAAPALRFGMEDVKFKRYLAWVDSQEHVRKVDCGFVCHDARYLLLQRYGPSLPKYGIYKERQCPAAPPF